MCNELSDAVLNEPGAIARLGIRIERPTMHQAANRTQPYPENPVRTSPAYLRNTTHATGVMLMFGIV